MERGSCTSAPMGDDAVESGDSTNYGTHRHAFAYQLMEHGISRGGYNMESIKGAFAEGCVVAQAAGLERYVPHVVDR